MISLRLVSILIAIVYCPAIVFAASATEILRRAGVADRYVSYRGLKTATVNLGGRSATATLKVVHLRPDRTRTEYFSPAFLAGIILIQDGCQLWKYHPREEEWERVRFVRGLVPEPIDDRVLQNYEIRLAGTDRVAGRQTYVVQAVPKRRGESARRLWIDDEHYLIIGTQVESPSGAIANSSRFSSVEFNPGDIPASAFKDNGRQQPVARNAASPAFKVEKPTYVPSGYRLVGMSCLSVNGCSSSHLQFSNGVNLISLFQHRAEAGSPPRDVKSKFTNVLTWVRDGMRFTLMGDLAKPELQKIRDSVR